MTLDKIGNLELELIRSRRKLEKWYRLRPILGEKCADPEMKATFIQISNIKDMLLDEYRAIARRVDL